MLSALTVSGFFDTFKPITVERLIVHIINNIINTVRTIGSVKLLDPPFDIKVIAPSQDIEQSHMCSVRLWILLLFTIFLLDFGTHKVWYCFYYFKVYASK